MSSLCYASEPWAYSGKDVEVVYRNGLRTALGVLQSTCNEITYIESNKYPLKCRILRQQLKFWLSVEEYVHLHPESALYRVIGHAKQLNLPYYKHDMLEEQYTTPNNCRNVLEAEYKGKWSNKFDNAIQDIDSRLETYNVYIFIPIYTDKSCSFQTKIFR